jgi:hypothetical protein
MLDGVSGSARVGESLGQDADLIPKLFDQAAAHFVEVGVVFRPVRDELDQDLAGLRADSVLHAAEVDAELLDPRFDPRFALPEHLRPENAGLLEVETLPDGRRHELLEHGLELARHARQDDRDAAGRIENHSRGKPHGIEEHFCAGEHFRLLQIILGQVGLFPSSRRGSTQHAGGRFAIPNDRLPEDRRENAHGVVVRRRAEPSAQDHDVRGLDRGSYHVLEDARVVGHEPDLVHGDAHFAQMHRQVGAVRVPRLSSSQLGARHAKNGVRHRPAKASNSGSHRRRPAARRSSGAPAQHFFHAFRGKPKDIPEASGALPVRLPLGP